MEHTNYLPAAGHDWALPLYDPLVRLLGIESTRTRLVERAMLRPSQSVLDIGCGTGSLVVLTKRRHPDVEVVGLDPDPKALTRARRKATRAGVSIQFDRGFSHELPHREASFDRVLSSFMFHHLDDGAQEATLRQVRRVLKPGGVLHLMDFAPESSPTDGRVARLLHAHHRLRGNTEDRLLAMLDRVGLTEASRVPEPPLRFGIRIASYRASRPLESVR